MSGVGVGRVRVNVFVAYRRRWNNFFVLRRRKWLPIIHSRGVVALRDTFLKLVIPASK
jgi:hypothetical protein